MKSIQQNRSVKKSARPYLGFGLGLRSKHIEDITSGSSKAQWFEALIENYMNLDGYGHSPSLANLEKVREKYPVVFHGVSLSLGGTDPFCPNYLKNWKELIQIIQPEWVSDHLSWTGVDSVNAHDLLPLPYTDEVLKHFISRVHYIQDYIQQPILIENASTYLEFNESEMSEWDFINEVSKQTQCEVLLDINNIYVNSQNHTFDPLNFINGINKNSVRQIHLAGHFDRGDIIIDTHDDEVCDPVWKLYEDFLKLRGPVSTMIERDDNIPELKELELELDKAKQIQQRLFSNHKVVEATI